MLENFTALGGVVLNDDFPIFSHAEEDAEIFALLGVLVAIFDELKNFFFLAFGQHVKLSVALRQLHSADKIFQIARGVLGGTCHAFFCVVFFLLNE